VTEEITNRVTRLSNILLYRVNIIYILDRKKIRIKREGRDSTLSPP